MQVYDRARFMKHQARHLQTCEIVALQVQEPQLLRAAEGLGDGAGHAVIAEIHLLSAEPASSDPAAGQACRPGQPAVDVQRLTLVSMSTHCMTSKIRETKPCGSS